MSGPKPDISALSALNFGKNAKKDKARRASAAAPPTPSDVAAPSPTIRPKGPSSVHSDGGGKFTLKDLLGGAPKLSRKSSARSTGSSRKSDSENGKSTVGGESTASLLKKYGTCERVAIGKGATSVVRLAHKWDRTEEKLYAVKEFRKRRKNETEKEYVKKLTAEFCISSTLHHINIVETVDLVQDEHQNWCEVMEFCPGGDLYAAIKKGRMSPSEIECCFKQILQGLSYLHSQGVAHRDIKPENLFFDTHGHLKIGDYGASTVYRLPWEATVHMSTGLCGSEPYIAPEQFLGKPYDARLVDIWAVGVVYYCLHFSELPWRVAQGTDNLYAAYVAACANPKETASPPTISNLAPRQCRSLIRRMLEPDPKSRALIEECMAHSWVQGIEVCHEVPSPSHVHVHAASFAQNPVQVLRE
ncbi:Pkinase-domain-containing protein [Auriscalpium vulgare]|uniref:Pkinase-domain-containing protein n=1 Tax=Auriscalpium vulgare TaxID=40419 RepID=A0ACB8RDK6_9AGAM|nr:Pkinase-domain-containing protein [Auriscalpium vulgare]